MKPAASKMMMVAAFPPPVHGQSVVTVAVKDRLAALGLLGGTCDVSPGSLTRSSTYHLRRIAKYARALVRIVNIRHTSRVYLVVESGMGILYTILCVAVSRVSNRSVVLHHHTSGHLLRTRLLHRIAFSAAGPEAQHLVLSEAMSRRLKTRYTSVNLAHVVSNASLVIPAARNPCEVVSGTFRIGMMGNLSREKGLYLATSLIQRLASQNSKVHLMLAGPISSEEDRQFIMQLTSRLPEKVEWLGPLHGSRKDKFYSDVDCIIFPSLYKNEAQPLVIWEALSNGRPVIATDAGFIWEMVDIGGYVFPSEQYVSRSAQIINGWIQDKERLRRAKSQAFSQFEEKRMVAIKSWQTFFESLLES